MLKCKVDRTVQILEGTLGNNTFNLGIVGRSKNGGHTT